MANTDEEDQTQDGVTTSLTSVFRGGSLFTVGYGASTFFGFLTNLFLTRLLGATGYGMFAYAKTVLELALKFSNLGTDKSLMRYLPAQSSNPDDQEATLTLAYGTSLAASLLTAAMLIAGAQVIATYTIDDPVFVDVLRLFALILVFDTLTQVVASTFRALELAEFDIFISRISRSGIRLVAAALSFFVGLQLFATVAVIMAASVITLGIAIWLAVRRLDIQPTVTVRPEIDIKEYYNYSLPLASKDLGSFFYTRADIIMIGIFLSSSAVGIYNIAVLLTTVITLPLSAVNQLFPPVASRLYSAENHDELAEVYVAVSRWSMTGALPLAIGAIVYRNELLALFGAEFVTGGTILAVLAIAKFVDTAVGPSGFMLMMTDHQYLLLANQWTFAAANIVLNYVFIAEFGVIGAAYASALVLAALNLLRVTEVWYLEGYHPFRKSFLKPIAASLPAASIMLLSLVISPVSSIVTMFVGGAIACFVYASCLFAFGIDPVDRKLYASR